jgi:hypothetical protein
MSRKDYIIIAEAMKRARYYDANPDYARGIDRAVLILVDVLKAENPRFDGLKFVSAAEYGKLPRLTEVA